MAVDATAVLQELRVRDDFIYGLSEGPVKVQSWEPTDIRELVGESEKASQVYAFMLSPLAPEIKPYPVAIVPVHKGESYSDVLKWESTIKDKAKSNDIHIIGFGADGDSKFRKYWTTQLSRPSDGPDFPAILSLPGFSTYSIEYDHFILPAADGNHIIKKLRNQILNVRKLLIIGDNIIQLEHIMEMFGQEGGTKASLRETDIYVHDRQNLDAAVRLFQPPVQEELCEWSKERSYGTCIYLKSCGYLTSALKDPHLSTEQRIAYVWKTVTFLKLWRAYLICSGLPLSGHFISNQCYQDCVLLGEGIVNAVLYLSNHYPFLPFDPSTWGSDACERFFGDLRCFVRGKTSFCVMEVIDLANRIIQQQNNMAESTVKDRHGSVSASKYTPKATHQFKPYQEMVKIITKTIKQAERDQINEFKEMGLSAILVQNNYASMDSNGELSITDENRKKLGNMADCIASNNTHGEDNPSRDDHVIDGSYDSDDDDDDDDDDGDDDGDENDNDDDYSGDENCFVDSRESDTENTESYEDAFQNDNLPSNESATEMVSESYYKRQSEDMVYIESKGSYMHKASAVSEAIGKRYHAMAARTSRFMVKKDIKQYYFKPDGLKKGDICTENDKFSATGEIVAIWQKAAKGPGSAIVFGETVRIIVKRKKNYHPIMSFCNRNIGRGMYHIYLKGMQLKNDTLQYERNKFYLINDRDILKVLDSKTISDEELKEINDIQKKRKREMDKKQKEDMEEKRKKPGEDLTCNEMRQILGAMGAPKYWGLKKKELIIKFERERSTYSTTPGNNQCYDGSSPPAKDFIYLDNFVYEDHYSCHAQAVYM